MGFRTFMLFMDLGIAAIMFLLGTYFYRSNGKAADLLTGYHMRTAEERKNFDENAMCKCYGKIMMAMAFPFLCGAVIDLFVTGVGQAMAWIVWVILFVYLIIKRMKLEKIK